MGEPFAPGVHVIERESLPAIQAAGAAFSGMVLRTKRGRDDIVSFVSNIEQFKRRYGGPDAFHAYGYESARDYFDENGTGLYVVRVVGSGATVSSKDIPALNAAQTDKAVALQTSSKGAWGNDTLLTLRKYVFKVIAQTGNTFTLAAVTGVEVGDVVRISDGTQEHLGFVYDIDASTKAVTVSAVDSAGSAVTVPSFSLATTYIYSTSKHKAKTTLAVGVTGAFTQMQVVSAAAVDKGALLAVISPTGARVCEVRVTAIVGNILNLTVVTSGGTAALPAGSSVVSMNFDVLHVVDGETTVHANLNLEPQDAINFAVNALVQSEYLRAVYTAPTTPSDYRSYDYPGVLISAAMTGGNDGSAPSDSDYLGTNNTKLYSHGVKLFDNVAVLPQFGIPGASQTVHAGCDAYAQNRGDTIFVFEPAVTVDTLDELLAYRNVELNLQSSYSALYAPWLIEPDALTPGAFVNVPPTGKVLGTYSEVATRRGTQKPPANEVITGVTDVTAKFTESEFALLNDAGVNLIRNVAGRGIRIAGARTQWPNADRKRFVNVRRILNAVKIGFRDFGVQIVQEPNDDVLWKKIQAEGEKFLENLWTQGWFFPRNDPTKAFFFRCDATTNTEALRLDAKVRAIAGINPVLPGELIIFEVALYDGGEVNVNEL